MNERTKHFSNGLGLCAKGYMGDVFSVNGLHFHTSYCGRYLCLARHSKSRWASAVLGIMLALCFLNFFFFLFWQPIDSLPESLSLSLSLCFCLPLCLYFSLCLLVSLFVSVSVSLWDHRCGGCGIVNSGCYLLCFLYYFHLPFSSACGVCLHVLGNVLMQGAPCTVWWYGI